MLQLLADLKLSKLSPPPAASVTGLFSTRFTVGSGDIFSNELNLGDAQSWVSTTPVTTNYSALCIKSDKPIQVDVVLPDNTIISFALQSVLVLTIQFKQVFLSYAKQVSDPVGTTANIRLTYA